MALVVEDGTGYSNAESYTTVAFFIAHHAARGNTLAATLLEVEIEQGLRRATDYMLQAYRGLWKGVRMTDTQALDWPREAVQVENFLISTTSYYVANNIVPIEVQRACCDLTFKAAAGEMLADETQKVISQKVEGIQVTYSEYSPQLKRYTAIDRLLKPYLAVSGNQHRVVR